MVTDAKTSLLPRGATSGRTLLAVTCAVIALVGIAVSLAVVLTIWLERISYGVDTAKSTTVPTTTPSTTPTPTTTSPPTPTPIATHRSLLRRFRKAAVASDSDVCSRVATDIMAHQGGSAVDAAIAAMLCVSVHHMHSSGIGGGAFAVVFNAITAGSETDRVETFDFRDRAPIMATRDMFVNASGPDSISQKGGLSICVPGEIKGYQAMHAKYGRLPWERLFKPAIEMCEKGVPVNKHLANALQYKADYIETNPTLKSIYLDENGNILKLGDTLKLPKLAQTLRRLSKNSKAFYEGDLAEDIAADLKDAGSIITLEDLANYTVSKRPFVKGVLGKYSMYTIGPPSSAALVPHMFNIINGYNITSADLANDESTILLYHRMVEALKYAFAKRTHMGDSDFVDMTQLLSILRSKDYGEQIRHNISDDKTFAPEHYGAMFVDDDSGTSHLSVIDPQGNAVALTSSINLYFGSGVVGNRTGIMFNDQMDDFSTPGLTSAYGVPPSEANFIEPRKRPLSSMSPTIIVDKEGKVKMVIGATGGTRIISTVFQLAVRALLLDQPLDTALDAARFHHQLVPNKIFVEPFFQEVYREGLRRKGHEVVSSGSFSVAQAIMRQGKYIMAISDDRKGGRADGF